MKLAIVLPIYNEEENLRLLYDQLISPLNKLGEKYEIVCVNDGSSDNSWGVLKDLASQDSNVKVVNFKNNFGQTAAMSAGIKFSQGEKNIKKNVGFYKKKYHIYLYLFIKKKK